MFRFPWSNFHELNLDWILEVVKEAKEIFINGEGDIQHAVETSEQALDVAEQAAAAVIADGAITIPKLNNEVLKTTAYVIVGNRADEDVPAGAYVYLRKSLVSGLSDGIYIAAAAIPAGAIVTPAEFQQPTELHDAGALNVLKNTLTQLETKVSKHDISSQLTATPSGLVGTEYSKNLTQAGQLVVLDYSFSCSSLSDISNTIFANIASGYRPYATVDFPCVIVKNIASGSSPIFSVPVEIGTNGNIRFPNIGGFSTVGAVDSNTRIYLHAVYFTDNFII